MDFHQDSTCVTDQWNLAGGPGTQTRGGSIQVSRGGCGAPGPEKGGRKASICTVSLFLLTRLQLRCENPSQIDSEAVTTGTKSPL